MVLRAGLDVVGKRRIFFFCFTGISTPDRRALSLVAIPPTLPWLVFRQNGAFRRNATCSQREVMGIRCFAECLENVFRITEYYIVITVTQPN